MFNTLNKLVNCFKNHYLRILIVPIFLLQVFQSSGQSFKLGSASEIVSHILDLGVQERQFNTVGCYSRQFCSERGRSTRSQRYFSAPLVQECDESGFTSFLIPTEQEPVAKVSTSENHAHFGDFYEAVKPLVYLCAAVAGWLCC